MTTAFIPCRSGWILLFVAAAAHAAEPPQLVPAGSKVYISSGLQAFDDTLDLYMKYSKSPQPAVANDFRHQIAREIENQKLPLTVTWERGQADYILNVDTASRQTGDPTYIVRKQRSGPDTMVNVDDRISLDQTASCNLVSPAGVILDRYSYKRGRLASTRAPDEGAARQSAAKSCADHLKKLIKRS